MIDVTAGCLVAGRFLSGGGDPVVLLFCAWCAMKLAALASNEASTELLPPAPFLPPLLSRWRAGRRWRRWRGGRARRSWAC